jgi:LysM repeat protein
MQNLRQLGGGLIIAVLSAILVLGGISLSLAESLPAPATPTQIPPTFPQSFPTPTFTITPFVETEIPTVTPTATSTATVESIPTTFLPPTVMSCSPPSGWIRVMTRAGDTIYSLAQRYKTSAENLAAGNCLPSLFELNAGLILFVPPVPTVTVVPCGPPYGWVRGYTVQPGDNLYRIALLYGISYTQLQRANCMGGSTTIYTGQRLWVPNIPVRTPIPATTTIPSFPTDTSLPPTLPPTDVPTEAPPTATSAPPTQAPTATQMPTIDVPVTEPPSS